MAVPGGVCHAVKALIQGIDADRVKETAIQMFGHMDMNGDGRVVKHELYNYLTRNTDLSMRVVDRLFALVDHNHDDIITKSEFTEGPRKRFGAADGVSLSQAVVMFNKRIHQKRPKPVSEPAASGGCSRSTGGPAGTRRPGAPPQAGTRSGRRPNSVFVPGSMHLNRISNTKVFDNCTLDKRSLRRIREVFCDADKNEDGEMTQDEFVRFLCQKDSSLETIAESVFATLDTEGTGRLSFKHLLAAMFPNASSAVLDDMQYLAGVTSDSQEEEQEVTQHQRAEDVRQVFTTFDTDGNGVLDEDEFVAGLMLLGYGEEAALEVFDDLDRRGTGLVNLDDFEGWRQTQESD